MMSVFEALRGVLPAPQTLRLFGVLVEVATFFHPLFVESVVLEVSALPGSET